MGDERFAFRHKREPPLALCVPFSFVTPDEVTLADHADRSAGIIEDGNRADVVFEEKLRDIPNRRIRGRRDDGARHHLTRIMAARLTCNIELVKREFLLPP